MTNSPQVTDNHSLDAAAVEAAQKIVSAVARRTPLDHSARLSHRAGMPTYLKREDQQIGRSYKLRGAYHTISHLGNRAREHGVACASAGNHAQGVAFACRQLHIPGTVYLPETTPRQKRARIADIGGKWITQVLTGATFDEASAAAQRACAISGEIFIHPFDDPHTIAGQGTVGVELLEQCYEQENTAPAAVIVPVGGGGLIAGITLWLKQHSPTTTIIGVEPDGAASMAAALRTGFPVKLPHIDGFIDGAAVAQAGEYTAAIVREQVDHLISISAGAVCSEMIELYQSEGIIVEPAGAMASAVVREGQLPQLLAGKDGASGAVGPIICVASGGNNDISRYDEILERALIHQGLRHYFLVTFPQRPGALRSFLNDVLIDGEDIVLFEYTKKNNRETGPALVGLEINHAEDLPDLLARMTASDLTIQKVDPESQLFGLLV